MTSLQSLDIELRLNRGAFALDVSFRAPLAGVTGIFGPSGCGKTTLLRAIAGLEKIESGHIRVGAQAWLESTQEQYVCLPVQQRQVGFVFQQPSLFRHLNVQKNLEYGLKRRIKTGVKSIGAPGESLDAKVNFDEIISLLDLAPLLLRDIRDLSGGEAQRVAVGRALLASPKLLLMDEPLASLDTARKGEILPYLNKLQGELKIPILYVSHSLNELVSLADHLVLMSQGRVTAEGPLMQVLANRRGLESMQKEPFTVWEGRVLEAKSNHHLTEVDVSGLTIRMPCMNVEEGQNLRLRLMAKDISLNLERAENSSILNIFEARVASIEDSDTSAQKLVRLAIGGNTLLARVSLLSCEKLALKTGTLVYAQIKAASLIQ